MLWLVDLIDSFLLSSLLKFKAVFVAEMFHDLLPKCSKLYSKFKFKTFFYL